MFDPKAEAMSLDERPRCSGTGCGAWSTASSPRTGCKASGSRPESPTAPT